MGEVYLAEHPRLPRRDALKVLPADVSADPDYRARFEREADLASKLWHPHIVSMHDRGEYQGQLWISMDFVGGQDAGRLLGSRFPAGMPADHVVRIVTAVASALDYAHKQGLLHRDVKPANIMIAHSDEDGEQRILLGDFGIARNIGEISGLTATNMTVGTVAYCAPEQLMGLDIDGRADESKPGVFQAPPAGGPSGRRGVSRIRRRWLVLAAVLAVTPLAERPPSSSAGVRVQQGNPRLPCAIPTLVDVALAVSSLAHET
jgi:serine/threonine protein kinase